jgi:hypothetical protein
MKLQEIARELEEINSNKIFEFKYQSREGVEKGILKSSIFYVDRKETLDMMEGMNMMEDMIEFSVGYEFRQSCFLDWRAKTKT